MSSCRLRAMWTRDGWIPQLDGLRGLAALSVIVAHFAPTLYLPGPYPYGWYAMIEALHGWSVALAAVALFFALSAFLLTYLAVREYDQTGAFGVRSFYWRRILRIWPLYLTVVALNLLAPPPWGPWMHEHWWIFLFASNWSLAANDLWGHLDMTSPLFAVLWSIAIEEQFYAVFPWGVRWLLHHPQRARRIAVGLIVAAVLARFIFCFVLPNDGPGNAARAYYATTTYLDTFALGGLMGWAYARRPSWYQQVERMLRRPGAWVPIVLVLVWLLAHWTGGDVPTIVWVPVFYAALALALALLLAWTVSNPDAPLVRLLASPPLRWLGLVSFGLYVWHPFAGALVTRVPLAHLEHADAALLAFVAYLALTLGMAALSFRLIERPFLKLRHHGMTWKLKM